MIAWLWARTVKSPNPAFAQVDVPLASTFMLSTKAGKEAYVEPVIENGGYRFTVKVGKPKDAEAAKSGTKLSRGANFQCLMSGTPIAGDYIKAEGKAGRMGARLMAIVAEGDRGRVYLAPTPEHEAVGAARRSRSGSRTSTFFRARARLLDVGNYGMTKWSDLFTARQLVALTTFSDLVQEARERVQRDALAAGLPDDKKPLRDGGTGADRLRRGSGGVSGVRGDQDRRHWIIAVARGARPGACPRYVRAASASDDLGLRRGQSVLRVRAATSSRRHRTGIAMVLEALPASWRGRAATGRCRSRRSISADKVVSTDPPYYDNVGYADLSDFFYVWLRRSLRARLSRTSSPRLPCPRPKNWSPRPTATAARSRREAFFLDGMTRAMHRLAEQAHPAFPVTIYYAFKQAESDDAEGTASTGWETFLDAVIRAGFAISGTWPMRTERERPHARQSDSNALASSIILVCRPRAAAAPTATRREFVSALKAELPQALAHLQRGNIAPVDLAQAAIGPGMAVYTRYAKVLDAEGKPLTRARGAGAHQPDPRRGAGRAGGRLRRRQPLGAHLVRAAGLRRGRVRRGRAARKSKNTSVAGMVEAGILESRHGKVRLLRPAELDPATGTQAPTDAGPRGRRSTSSSARARRRRGGRSPNSSPSSARKPRSPASLPTACTSSASARSAARKPAGTTASSRAGRRPSRLARSGAEQGSPQQQQLFGEE